MILIQPNLLRGRRKVEPSPAPVAGVTITSVTQYDSPTQVLITFSGPIAWNGTDVPASFQAFTGGRFEHCMYAVGVGPDTMVVEFDGNIEGGAAWQVDGPMAGILPAVSFPQSGIVE